MHCSREGLVPLLSWREGLVPLLSWREGLVPLLSWMEGLVALLNRRDRLVVQSYVQPACNKKLIVIDIVIAV